VHPRDNDLILGTHGRSIYIMDDITLLQQLSEAVQSLEAFVFDVRPNVQWLNDPMTSRGVGGAKHFRGDSAPEGVSIGYYLKSAPQGEVKIAVTDMTGKVVRDLTATKNAGINRVQWNFRTNPPQGGRGSGGGRGAGAGAPPAAGAPAQAAGIQAAAAPAGGGGRGGGGTAVEPGTYLVKVTIGDKEFIKPVVVEADRLLR
jgi:hypothetical protein